MPLKEILRDKKIVAMGEATHGTAEFFQMKHRMFEFLVKEMDYRVFGIEANFGSSKVINDYILHGEGSVEKCLDAMGFWTWDTKEVGDMIDWMRDYNKNVKDNDKIKFYGFDMQSIDNSLIYVLDYLYKVGSPSIEGYNARLKNNRDRIIRISKGNTNEVAKDIDKIHNEIIENKDKYIVESSTEEYNLILHHIETIYQCLDYKKDDSFNNRDYYMAENVNWILDYENKYYGNENIMLWAHNGHVGNEDNVFTIMGENLKKHHGDDYYSIGFDFYKGEFVAVPSRLLLNLGKGSLANISIDSTPKGSFAYEMMKTDEPISFLDFNGTEENEILLEFLSKKVHVNSIGAAYVGKSYNITPNNQIILKDTFDGMIFIESTTGAMRSRGESELPDGNKIILFVDIFKMVIAIVAIIILVRMVIKVAKKSKSKKGVKYHILEEDNEELIKKKSLKGLIVKINDYFNSISTIKYLIFVIIGITILNLISTKINSINILSMVPYMNITAITTQLLALTVVGLIEIYLTFILPFLIVKRLLDKKTTKLVHIIIAATIGAIINTLSYFDLGISIYYLNVLLSLIGGIIYCYSYDLFHYREEKPIVNFAIIFLFSYALIMIFSM